MRNRAPAFFDEGPILPTLLAAFGIFAVIAVVVGGGIWLLFSRL